jgi:hypothetical protein
MTMQTDVKSAYRTTTGVFQNEAASANLERVRLKGVFVTGTGTAIFADGSGGTTRLTLNNTGSSNVYIPGEGILFNSTVHVTISGVTGCTIFYG